MTPFGVVVEGHLCSGISEYVTVWLRKVQTRHDYWQDFFESRPNPKVTRLYCTGGYLLEPILFGLKGMAQDMAAKQSTQLFLLAKQDKLEVIRQIVAADRPLRFSPGDENSFEFVFVIRGSLCQLNKDGQQGRTLESGDFITIHGLKEKAFFRTLTEVEFLYVTNTPMFYGQKKKIDRKSVV